MHMRSIIVLVATVFFSLLLPFSGMAAETNQKMSAWVPYWAPKEGTKSVMQHLSSMSEVYPFVYSVKRDGTLKENTKLKSKEWQKLFKAARGKSVPVIPTIMSGDGEHIHTILSDAELRTYHVQQIVSAVEKGKFDGIDIDYENRSKKTITYFSQFLRELKTALGKKKLVCTLEPRTPPDSLWEVVPNPLPYSNDYSEIAKYCDLIQIMAYDQQRADLKLNESRTGLPYYPVADKEWVQKVVNLTGASLPKEKLMLGVPTYGNHVIVTVSPDWFEDYSSIGALNEHHALELADDYQVTPARHDSGEMVMTYLPKTMPKKLATAIRKMSVEDDVPDGLKAAMQALAYANKTGESVLINMVWWSDAKAIADKVAMVKKAGWRGVSVFKIDGQEPKGVWDTF